MQDWDRGVFGRARDNESMIWGATVGNAVSRPLQEAPPIAHLMLSPQGP